MCYGVGKVGFRCCAVLCYAMLCWGGRQPPAAASALAHSWSLLCAQLPTGLHCIKLAETSAKPSVKSKGRREVPPAAPLGWQLTTPIPKDEGRRAEKRLARAPCSSRAPAPTATLKLAWAGGAARCAPGVAALYPHKTSCGPPAPAAPSSRSRECAARPAQSSRGT